MLAALALLLAIDNPAIDMHGYLQDASHAATVRERKRLCNNNFENAEGPFPTKAAKASLNLSTYIALYTYGYDNVYELGPLVDIHASKLSFESCK